MLKGFFGGFVGTPRVFSGFDIWPHSIIPVTLNLKYPLGSGGREKRSVFSPSPFFAPVMQSVLVKYEFTSQSCSLVAVVLNFT